jgi:hypothetical protein
VQNTFGQLRESGFEGLIHELTACFGYAPDHPIEFPCQDADFVGASEIELGREIGTSTYLLRMADDLRQRTQDDLVQCENQEDDDGDRRTQVDGGRILDG